MKIYLWIMTIILIFVVISLGAYYAFLPLPSSHAPNVPTECWKNYPYNITFAGQKVYHYFWSNECCSNSFFEGYNDCWRIK